MQRQTIQLGGSSFSSAPQPSHLGPGLTRLPWIFIVAGGVTALFSFSLLFFVATVCGLETHLSNFFYALIECQALTYICCIFAMGGCVVAGIGYTQLKTYYGSQGNVPAADSLKKLALYSFIMAGLFFIITIFFIPLSLTVSYWYKTWGIYLFFVASASTAFGLIHFVTMKEWLTLVKIMNWADNFTKFLKLGYTLAFWSITVPSALLLTFSICMMATSSLYGFLEFISAISMLAYWGALAGGALWMMAQAKLMIRFGNVFPAKQPIMQHPYQQPLQQPYQPQQFQQPYQPQQFNQPQQQPYQPQQFNQPQQQQDYNERLRQQQYEEYRRQQQQRMREQGEDSHETMPYNKQ